MKTLRERQAYMVRVIQTLDRALVEASGRPARVISHLQTPHAAPGQREAVCIHGEGGRQEHLPYGVALERQVNLARRWVREGEGPKPVVVRSAEGTLALQERLSGEDVVPLVETERPVMRRLV